MHVFRSARRVLAAAILATAAVATLAPLGAPASALDDEPKFAAVTYTGPFGAEYHDAFTATATVTAGLMGAPLSGLSIRFIIGDENRLSNDVVFPVATDDVCYARRSDRTS